MTNLIFFVYSAAAMYAYVLWPPHIHSGRRMYGGRHVHGGRRVWDVKDVGDDHPHHPSVLWTLV